LSGFLLFLDGDETAVYFGWLFGSGVGKVPGTTWERAWWQRRSRSQESSYHLQNCHTSDLKNVGRSTKTPHCKRNYEFWTCKLLIIWIMFRLTAMLTLQQSWQNLRRQFRKWWLPWRVVEARWHCASLVRTQFERCTKKWRTNNNKLLIRTDPAGLESILHVIRLD